MEVIVIGSQQVTLATMSYYSASTLQKINLKIDFSKLWRIVIVDSF